MVPSLCNHQTQCIKPLFTFSSVVTPKKIVVKLTNVPPTKEIVAESIRSVTSEHQNKFIILFGTVVRTGHVHSRELYKEFQCKACEKTVVCESDISECNRFIMPPKCTGKVETKVNPFFKIAKTLMEKMKSKAISGGKGEGLSTEDINDLNGNGGRTKVNSDF